MYQVLKQVVELYISAIHYVLWLLFADTKQYFRNNYAEISLSFKDNFYEMHVQNPATTPSSVLVKFPFSVCRTFTVFLLYFENMYFLFSGSIGGNMGLFMGMSAITLMEIFVFLLTTVKG